MDSTYLRLKHLGDSSHPPSFSFQQTKLVWPRVRLGFYKAGKPVGHPHGGRVSLTGTAATAPFLMKPLVKLENWFIGVKAENDPYLAPELHKVCLHGEAYGHPEFADGTFVTIPGVIGQRDGMIHTKRTVYELGEVKPEYLKQFPDACERFLKSLPEYIDDGR